MKFEWDEDKNIINKEKHKISFETAAYVFDDPYYKKQEQLLIIGCTAQRTAPFIRSKGQLLISYIILKCLILNIVLMKIGILQ